ncbi:MAG: glycosyltransferase [Bauldia sp.]
MPGRNAVFLVTDEKLFPAAAFAAGRLAELNNRNDTDIIVFTDAADELRLAPSRAYPFEVVPMVQPDGVNLPPTYFRIFVPPQLASRYSRLLYLDVDTYVENETPFALFDLDLRGHALAAVRDYVIACSPDWAEIQAVFGSRHFKYFNAGVLLIDTAGYVARHASEKMLQVIASGTSAFRHRDQSSLNHHFNGDFAELSPAFNMFGVAEGTPLPLVAPPVLTHFVSRRKPWMGPLFGSDHKARAEMERFFPTSPWPNFLGRFYNADAKAPPGRPPNIIGGFQGQAPIAHYLRETPFADVAAGLTRLNLDALQRATAPA